jgi:hypothetical protein
MIENNESIPTPGDPDRAPGGWDWSGVLPGPEKAAEAIPDTEPRLTPLSTRSSVAVDPYCGHLRSSRGTYCHKDFHHTVIIQGPPPRAPLWRQKRKLSSSKPYPIG